MPGLVRTPLQVARRRLGETPLGPALGRGQLGACGHSACWQSHQLVLSGGLWVLGGVPSSVPGRGFREEPRASALSGGPAGGVRALNLLLLLQSPMAAPRFPLPVWAGEREGWERGRGTERHRDQQTHRGGCMWRQGRPLPPTRAGVEGQEFCSCSAVGACFNLAGTLFTHLQNGDSCAPGLSLRNTSAPNRAARDTERVSPTPGLSLAKRGRGRVRGAGKRVP